MHDIGDLACARQDRSESFSPIFGAHAAALRRAGLAVLPARGKKPLRGGFDKWKAAPALKTVETWCERNRDDNIVYIPGLSRSSKNPHGLIVVDADNAEAIEVVERRFGPTPAMIETRRGRHSIYRAPEGDLGKIGSLRSYGVEADIKHGQKGSGIVVAPPSRHDKDPSFTYGWAAGSGLEALSDLPEFNVAALRALIGSCPNETLGNATQLPPAEGQGPRQGSSQTLGKAYPHLFPQGSRKLGLNKHLCAHGWAFEDLDGALDVARTWNDDLADRWGVERLPDPEVFEVCLSVLKAFADERLTRTAGRRAICTSDADEIRWLTETYDNGAEAFTLLQLLRSEHGAKLRRGETFALVIEAMVKARTLGRWSYARYKAARETLLSAGLLKMVKPAGGKGIPAQYTLSARAVTASLKILPAAA